MFLECLTHETLICLENISKSKVLEEKGFYLAGGTGLALQLGHRLSEDLDFFTTQNFSSSEIISRFKEQEVKIIDEAPDTLHLLFKNQKISFFYYPYPPLYSFAFFPNCPIANYLDIATMKLIAISQRGAKKDFIDLYFIITKKNLSLSLLFTLLEKKYPVKYSKLHILRSLTFFEDAEGDPMPLMNRGTKFTPLAEEEWELIKVNLIKIQKDFLKRNI
ncbi:Nucleotidyl transferase AbiEii toxin, Type IV TA system [Thermosyntropha lipolytica DSM 11003]|uniref:Nucleotidyl transferase AbiEii toxin, Type IV TA system n=1 Tax=Thermosyntropha lipolytica DSM 11003 TaxID=1123382 RepID=A0A1M5JTK9_9FIRM|nr:nucleotidyl transferase AbiEii/AbiGii toxin family protein [Thermosyntropha lipolytica]SHG43589.1 Nucleotidyl transferase AbiEii toxin, Type IV TA system [Thermosyntropha lipolytica DSM 11003]